MHKPNCVSKNDVKNAIVKLVDNQHFAKATGISEEHDRMTRVNIFDIKGDDVLKMVKSFSADSLIESEKVSSKSISNKLKDALKKASLVNNKDYVTGIVDKLFVSGSASGRANAMGLKMVLETITGEINKANNNNVDLNTVSNQAGIPYIPTHRLAASLGRQIYYVHQYRVHKGNIDKKDKAKHVEHLYYVAGMKALKALQQQGFITIHEAGKVTTVKDYLAEGEGNFDYKERTTDAVQAIELNAEALGAKTLDLNSNDAVLKQIRGTAKERIPIVKPNSEFDSLLAMLRAVGLVSVPASISLPYKNIADRTNAVRKDDAYTLNGTAAEVRNELENKPVYLSGAMTNFFRSLSKTLNSSDKDASSWIKEFLTTTPALAQTMFGFEQKTYVDSDTASARGRNLSKTTPINDLVEYFDSLYDKNGRFRVFMNLFGGRNVRLYYENSVLNPQSSKFMRHALEVEPYTIETNSPAYRFFGEKISHSLADAMNGDVTPEQVYLALEGNGEPEIAAKIERLTKSLDAFYDGNNAKEMLIAASNMYRNFDGIDMAEMVSLAQAVKDYKNGAKVGKMTSSYMVSSDATASGGQLTLMQALGVSDSVPKLLKQLKIFKGSSEGESKLKDVYAILQKELDVFFNPENRPDDDSRLYSPEFETSDDENAVIKDVLKSVLDTLYDGNARNLSKGPTMTFIYDQSESGAVESLSKEFTNKFIEKLSKTKYRNDSAELSNILKVLGLDENYSLSEAKKNRRFARDMANAFGESGAPSFLYKTLQHSLTDMYLKEFKDRADQVFDLVNEAGTDKIKVFPASVVMDMELKGIKLEYTKENLDKYGVPLTKIFETAKSVGEDTVLTREERLRKTIMNVSLIHGADMANLVYSLDGLNEKYNSGALIIHDDIRSRPDLVMEAEQKYIQANKDLATHYDIHEQVMKSVAVYADASGNNELKNSVKYTKLMSQITAQKEAKAKLIGDKKNGYNSETDSIIGDKGLNFDGVKNRNEQSLPETGSSNVAPEKSAEPSTSTENSVVPKLGLLLKNKLDKARSNSPLIDAFLSSKTGSKVVSANASNFDPEQDVVKLDTSLSDSKFLEEAEHEIVHAYTAALIQDHIDRVNPSNEMAYIEKAMNRLNKFVETATDTGGLSNEAFGRAMYIQSKGTKQEQMAEFIAIMTAEPEVAAELYKKLDNSNRLADVVKRLLARIRDIIVSPTEQDVLSADIDAVLLESSLNTVLAGGKSLRENQYDTFMKLQKRFGKELGYNKREVTGPVSLTHSWMDAINDSMSRHVVMRAADTGTKLSSNIDRLLKQHVPAYARVVRRAARFYDDSTALQQIMHKVTNGNINQLKKNEILSIFSKVAADKESITSTELQRFKVAMKGVSDVDLAAFHDFNTKMSMADYFTYFPDGVDNVDQRIAQLEKSNFSPADIKSINRLVDFYVNDVFTKDTPYNLEQAGFKKGSQADLAKQLLVLKSIKAIGPNRLRDLSKNTGLMDVTRDNVMANATILARNPNIKTDQLRSTGLIDEYKEPVVFKAISQEELKFYDESNDWKVLRSPTDKKVGVVYKTLIDGNYQAGVFTGIQMNSGDIQTTAANKGKEGVVKVGNEYKLILTRKEKLKAGLIENSAQSIVRTMTHNLAIQDSNVIREKLLEDETHYDISGKGVEQLVKIINDKESENPWFLNDIADRNFNTLPNKVKSAYMRVPVKMSNVDGFDQRVKYVRKDIAYWLVGSNEGSISNNKAIQTGIRIAKNLISGTKIGMVILNPIKIANDNVFNAVYLTTLGVDVGEMIKSYSNVSNEYHDYMKLKDRVNSLRVMAYAEPNKHGAEIDRLVKQLEEHPFNNVVKKGFTNSLASDIIMQDDNPNGGFKADIDKVLTAIFKDKKGQNNKLAEVVLRVAKSDGFQMEGFLETFSGMFGVRGETKNVESELKRMGKRFEELKSDDDIVGYMHQFINSPDSEFVKLGTHMTDLTDILAKETYYRHLVGTKGMSEGEAEKAVITAFPDYKEGLPTMVQKLDSVGIVMYPQYWLRMIQAMYRLAEKRPASFGSEMLIAQLMGTESQLWSQTIIEKAMSNWGLIHNPTNHIGWGSIAPTNVW